MAWISKRDKQRLTQMAATLDSWLATPEAVVDLAKLKRDLSRMAGFAESHPVNVLQVTIRRSSGREAYNARE